MNIDAHHHFWNYNPEEYGWMEGPIAPLRRDYGPDDLKPLIDAAGIDGVISVQARQCLAENDFLLDYADRFGFIKGVVGWVPLADAKVETALERYAGHPAFIAVRHVVQDEPDDEFLLRPDFNRGVARLKDHGLVYDILIYERQLDPAIRFVDRHPDQVFVLDHIAKPKIGLGELDPWKTRIADLAKRENVYCKVSGLATEADFANWRADQFLPYLETVLECFGPDRLMFGSDWPVATLAIEYAAWLDLAAAFFGNLSEEEQARVFGATAVKAYGLD
jgi:L-fuconolactonase